METINKVETNNKIETRVETKDKVYGSVILAFFVLTIWLWKSSPTIDGNQVLNLNDNLLKAGVVVALGQNIDKLNKSVGFDLINNKMVEPCTQLQELSEQEPLENECEVRITKEEGKVVLITRYGERIIPKDVSNHTIVLYTIEDTEKSVMKDVLKLIQPISTAEAADHKVCLSDLNGSQRDFCWPKVAVRNWCQSHTHSICNLV